MLLVLATDEETRIKLHLFHHIQRIESHLCSVCPMEGVNGLARRQSILQQEFVDDRDEMHAEVSRISLLVYSHTTTHNKIHTTLLPAHQHTCSTLHTKHHDTY